MANTPDSVDKVQKTAAQWRDQLSPEAFTVCRQKGTEAPWSGTLLDEKRLGQFVCACCQQPLFNSDSKYDSGSGWPSFYKPLTDNVVETTVDQSFGMVRTEAHCAKCDAHLGHIFDDGPDPTGLRYCMNSASLNLVINDKNPK